MAKKKKKRKKISISKGRAYIKATYNNTLITITDVAGQVLVWSSAGHQGFKGPKKATPYAATKTAQDIVNKVNPMGLKEVDVFVSGIGYGRESAIRALNNGGIKVKSIKDITPIPHNGPKKPKPRRV